MNVCQQLLAMQASKVKTVLQRLQDKADAVKVQCVEACLPLLRAETQPSWFPGEA